MTYSVKSVRSGAAIPALVEAHHEFFKESVYRNMTWDADKMYGTLLGMMQDSDFEVLVAYAEDGSVAGFFEFAFESPCMKEEVALCIYFYILPKYRDAECSQMLLDFGTEICQNRGAKFLWKSSTAGFSDNGCNERAYKMFLKRNGFKEIGTFLVREFGDEQSQKGCQEGIQGG